MELKRVRFLETRKVNGGQTFLEKAEYDLPINIAAKWVKNGRAEYVEASPVKRPVKGARLPDLEVGEPVKLDEAND